MLINTKMPITYTLAKIKTELFLVCLYALAIVLFFDEKQIKFISIPIAIPALLGTAISLILSFRTAQAYDRWWEARKIWGSIVNDSRTLVRQAQTFIHIEGDQPKERAVVKKLAIYQIAFAFALSKSLREEDPLVDAARYLDSDELTRISKEKNIPNAILQLHADLIRQSISNRWVNNYSAVQLDETVVRLTASMGQAERIKATIFPITYTILVEFILYLFVLLLPLGLTEYFSYLVAPMLVLISAPFFLLEKVALKIQNPFNGDPTDTPVTSISQNIEVNLMQMVGEKVHLPVVDENKKSFYIM